MLEGSQHISRAFLQPWRMSGSCLSVRGPRGSGAAGGQQSWREARSGGSGRSGFTLGRWLSVKQHCPLEASTAGSLPGCHLEGTEDRGSDPLSIMVDGGQWPQAALFTGQLRVGARKRFFLWMRAVLLWRQRGSETPILGGSQCSAGPSCGQPDPWWLPFLAKQEPGLERSSPASTAPTLVSRRGRWVGMESLPGESKKSRKRHRRGNAGLLRLAARHAARAPLEQGVPVTEGLGLPDKEGKAFGQRILVLALEAAVQQNFMRGRTELLLGNLSLVRQEEKLLVPGTQRPLTGTGREPPAFTINNVIYLWVCLDQPGEGQRLRHVPLLRLQQPRGALDQRRGRSCW